MKFAKQSVDKNIMKWRRLKIIKTKKDEIGIEHVVIMAITLNVINFILFSGSFFLLKFSVIDWAQRV